MSNDILNQWVGVAQNDAKEHEFGLYMPPQIAQLVALGVTDIIEFQADEGRLSKAWTGAGAKNHRATFVLTQTGLDTATQTITAEGQKSGTIRLVTTPQEVAKAGTQAIVFNNILSCLDDPDAVVADWTDTLDADGYALVTINNPEGGPYSTYACTDLPEPLTHGMPYKLHIAGVPDIIDDRVQTRDGIIGLFNRQGFGLLAEDTVEDSPAKSAPAFRQFLFQKLAA